MQEMTERILKDDYLHLEDMAMKAAAQFLETNCWNGWVRKKDPCEWHQQK